MVTDLRDSHKGWKEKFIRIKSMGGFGVFLKWQVVDGSPNVVFEVTEIE